MNWYCPRVCTMCMRWLRIPVKALGRSTLCTNTETTHQLMLRVLHTHARMHTHARPHTHTHTHKLLWRLDLGGKVSKGHRYTSNLKRLSLPIPTS